MILKIKIKVSDKIEAYKIVSELGLEHEVVEAEFNGKKEEFDKENIPAYFLRDNNKNIAKFRSKKYELR
jgi:hypothetical protein